MKIPCKCVELHAGTFGRCTDCSRHVHRVPPSRYTYLLIHQACMFIQSSSNSSCGFHSFVHNFTCSMQYSTCTSALTPRFKIDKPHYSGHYCDLNATPKNLKVQKKKNCFLKCRLNAFLIIFDGKTCISLHLGAPWTHAERLLIASIFVNILAFGFPQCTISTSVSAFEMLHLCNAPTVSVTGIPSNAIIQVATWLSETCFMRCAFEPICLVLSKPILKHLVHGHMQWLLLLVIPPRIMAVLALPSERTAFTALQYESRTRNDSLYPSYMAGLSTSYAKPQLPNLTAVIANHGSPLLHSLPAFSVKATSATWCATN